eukprot:m.178729 g.178729  ORF g.178729 m.178729 type:complete len:262 (+) comp21424_c8_seq2:174-959(+)
MATFAHIPLPASFALCVGMGSAYIGSLYYFTRGEDRQNKRTVQKRSAIVVAVAAGCATFLHFIAQPEAGAPSVWEHVGVRSKDLGMAVLFPLATTMVFYFGPFVQDRLSGYSFWREIVDNCDWNGFRDVLIAPFTEEFVFRACMMPLLLPHLGVTASVWLCPPIFGLAHIHHYFTGGVPIPVVLLQSVYTTVFGWYTAFLFGRTNHVVGIALSHCFCNFMGAPNLPAIPKHRYKKTVIATYLLGLAGFIYMVRQVPSLPLQ